MIDEDDKLVSAKERRFIVRGSLVLAGITLLGTVFYAWLLRMSLIVSGRVGAS